MKGYAGSEAGKESYGERKIGNNKEGEESR